MYQLRRLFGVFAALLLCFPAFSQPSAVKQGLESLFYESADPESDAAAIATMRARMSEIRKTRPTVAVVLSGGGAKGAAHVGALKYLEELGIPVDMVCGTSMGGLMGGLYALGYPAQSIDSLLRAQDWSVIMSDKVPWQTKSYANRRYTDKYAFTVPFRFGDRILNEADEIDKPSKLPEGFLSGYNVQNMLSSLSVGYQDSLDFADLPIPYFCVASDLVSLKEYNWTKGKLIDAMRSTMSIPFYFMPVRTNGMVLTDGGTRNNFPVDLARAMGADYVIGVDLHVEREYSDVTGLGSFLMQLINITGADAYGITREDTDVLIEPQVSDFNMLSFDSEAIATLIGRGYASAKVHSGELESILEATSSDEGRHLSAPRARDINSTKVQLEAVVFEGITPEEANYFRNRLTIQAGGSYDKADIEEEMSHIYASGAFEKVTYSLLGESEPYRLVFVCTHGPEHRFSVGVRMDTEELVSATACLGLFANRLNGSALELSFKIGNNGFASVDYSNTPVKGYKFGAKVKTVYNTSYIRHFPPFGSESPYMKEWASLVRFYGTNTSWVKGTTTVGIDFENSPFLKITNVPVAIQRNGWRDFAVSAFANFRIDSTDDSYFPTKGLRFGARSHFIFESREGDVRTGAYITAASDLLFVIPFGKSVAMIPSLSGRFVFADDPFYRHSNYVGGSIAGRYFEEQIPYIGVGGVYEVGRLAAVANLDTRISISRNDFLTLSAAALAFSEKNSAEAIKQTAAAALRFSHKTAVGPLSADIHWDYLTRRVGLYASVGYNF